MLKGEAGIPQKARRAAIDAIRETLQELTGKDFGPDADLRIVLELLVHGDLKDGERLQAWTQLLKYTRAQLKAVELNATVKAVEVQLTPKEVEAILHSDPFAKPVELQPREIAHDPDPA